jgi:hydrogenase nickel incorporation protein HypA/HybF
MSDALSRAVAAAESAGARRIERLTFTYDPTGHVTPEIVETLFHVMSNGTPAQGAALVVEPREVRLRCLRCDQNFLVSGSSTVCPACQGAGIRVDEVPELVLESIDVDE